MSWFFFAFLSLLFWVIYDIASRALAIESKNPRAFAFLYNTFAGLFSLTFFLFEPFQFRDITPFILILAALMVLLYGVFNRYEYYAHKFIEASTLTFIIKIAPIITFLLSITLLGESLTILKILAALLIFSGILLVTYKKGAIRLQKGIGYGFLIAIVLGFAWVIDKRASSHFPLPLWAFMGYFVPNIFVVSFPMLSWKNITGEWKRLTWRVILLAAFAACGYYLFIKALSLGDASNVILIMSCATILNVLFAAFFLKERSDMLKKVGAAVLVIAGQLLLYFG